MERRKKPKTALLGWSKFNSIDKTISEALINSDISHEKLTLVIHGKLNYLRLKESIRMKDNLKVESDIER